MASARRPARGKWDWWTAATSPPLRPRSLRHHISTQGRRYRLTGPELLSYYDIAATLSALLGRTVSYRELTMDENRDAMIRAGVPEAVAQMNAEAFSLIAAGDAAWLSDDVQSLLGRPPRSFAQFAADYTSVFSAPAS